MNIKQRRLPSAYQEVEWIGTTGTQWIDTTVVPTALTNVYLKAMRVGRGTTTYDIPFGQRTANAQYLLSHSETNVIGDFGNTSVSQGTPVATNQLFEWSNSNSDTTKIYYIDGSQYATARISSFTATALYSLKIGGFNNGSSTVETRNSSYRWYNAKLWDDSNSLIRNFIPCYRISDSVIGMYDIVNGVFYTNQGTGSFTKGPDVVTVNNITIPEGTVVRMRDSSNNVLWQKKYGGIGIARDNVNYAYNHGRYLQDVVEVPSYFIAEVIDRGASTPCSITWNNTLRLQTAGVMREFVSLDSSSYDYWGIATERTITVNARYLSFPIPKEVAPYFYVYDNTNQRYLLKGDMVN